ncbi:phasin family protein [Phenylobacterium sp. LjRoot219]|uniref:phasin family protein n=1 Tax=Phenylobacterium sp. LjRoot219 TaxID=3342283 RepID=UPI003ED07E72
MPDPLSSPSTHSSRGVPDDNADTATSAAIGERERTFAPPPQLEALSRDIEGARAGASNTFEVFEKLSRTLSQAFAGGPGQNDLAFTASTPLTRIAEETSRAWLSLAQRAIAANLAALTELSKCQTAPDLAAWHTWVVREQLQLASEAGEAVVAIATRAIEQAKRTL